MLVTLIPLFDQNMSVRAYSLYSQKKNYLLEPGYMSAATQAGDMDIPGFEVIESIGLDTLSSDCEIFVPVSSVSLFTDVPDKCKADFSRIILLLDRTVEPTFTYTEKIMELKNLGFRFAIRNLEVSDFEPFKPILRLMDYIFLNHQKIVISKAKIYFNLTCPHIKLIASGIATQGMFDSLKFEGYKLFEGSFYRMPLTQGSTELSPLKINYISLLNLVNGEDFDLTAAADIIGQDTALIISLLKMVNKINRSSTEITSIRHAAAMLGQKELKKWITTAIAKQLCSDKPSELMRVSLLRAKFAETLAPVFELGVFGSELFLMGLFSVVDIILGKPMNEALELLKVSKNVNDALINGAGPFADVLNFIKLYEAGDWQEISRIMLLNNIPLDKVYNAYIATLEWYRDLFASIDAN